jgi:hypothetical protein
MRYKRARKEESKQGKRKKGGNVEVKMKKERN